MGLLDQIKKDAQSSSVSKKDFFYVREGEKRRIRFLQDMEDGFSVDFHKNFEENIDVPCQTLFGRKCRYCDDESVRTKTMYVWSVWDYDSSTVQLFMFSVNKCSPIGALAASYETFGTITDRDYMISTSGKRFDKTYSVTAMDKSKFRNDKAKPFSKQAALKLIDKAYPDTLSGGNKASDGDGEDWDEDAMNKPENDYMSKKPKELFDMCKERGIECEPKKPAKYYANLLEEDDKAQDDWADGDEDEEEWEE